MAKTIPHRELRNNSSEILREVQSGETFRITNNGKVVAVLTPPPPIATTEVPVRRATIKGRFDQIRVVRVEPQAPINETTHETLDYLRGDK
ncbi:MAG TPA: type II toxin-antitoxin system prevent-host-death family antitoxin [Galbitalea sp.]|jgi:prevent-host-death family protein|nr:type II toxin-antitoxin system prevent-host-death family antitoxin [Galbitalea sp.]